MFKKVQSKVISSSPEALARSFTRFGRIGFWIQLALAGLPILLTLYVLFFSPTASLQRSGFDWSEWLALLGLIVLVFTIFWFHQYKRLAQRMADPVTRPSKPSVVRTLWIGLMASSVGILVSMVLIFVDLARLLFVFLRAPQGGMPVIQTEAYDPSSWVSAIDVVSLLADFCVLSAEWVVLTFSLWLLFRMTVPGRAYEDEPADPGA